MGQMDTNSFWKQSSLLLKRRKTCVQKGEQEFFSTERETHHFEYISKRTFSLQVQKEITGGLTHQMPLWRATGFGETELKPNLIMLHPRQIGSAVSRTTPRMPTARGSTKRKTTNG